MARYGIINGDNDNLYSQCESVQMWFTQCGLTKSTKSTVVSPGLRSSNNTKLIRQRLIAEPSRIPSACDTVPRPTSLRLSPAHQSEAMQRWSLLQLLSYSACNEQLKCLAEVSNHSHTMAETPRFRR